MNTPRQEEVNEEVTNQRANFVRINLRQMMYILASTATESNGQSEYIYEFWLRNDSRFDHSSKVILQIDNDGDVELFMLVDTSNSIGDSLKQLRNMKPDDSALAL